MHQSLSTLLGLGLLISAASARQHVDINAISNAANNPLSGLYEPGTYQVFPISPVHGGAYLAWSTHLGNPGSFLHRYSLESTEFGYQEPGGTIGYQPTTEAAYLGAVSTSFTIVTQALVNFYVCDGPGCYAWAGDNTGGISLLVGQAQGTRYCVSEANTTGTAATLHVLGSDVAADQDLTLVTEGVVPGESALYYYGSNQLQLPFGDGYRCVGGFTTRLGSPTLADMRGLVVQVVAPHFFATGIRANSTLNFQLWYRDPASVNSFNLSDAVSVTFR